MFVILTVLFSESETDTHNFFSMQGIAMETEKESGFALSFDLYPRYLCGADYCNADLSALWDEAGCSGRQNETPLSAP